MGDIGLNELRGEIESLKSEISDLKLMLEAVTGHSDGMEADLMEQIRAGERLFHIISKTIPVPIVIAKRDTGEIVFANEHAYRVFGFSSRDILMQKSVDLYENPEDRMILLKILSDRGWVENLELRLKRRDGPPFWASLFSQPITFRDEECLFTVVYDLTERKRAEESKISLERQLRQVQKMEAIGTLASGIAHDFNNILTIIFGNLELSEMKLPPDSPVRKNISNALTAAINGRALVRQILTFCCKTEQEQKPFRISAVVSEASDMIRSLISSKIHITLRIEDESAIVMGDPIQIHQVLMNLCSNSAYVLKEKGGTIDIFLKKICFDAKDEIMIPHLQAGSYAVLTVRDNGPGIEKRIIDRIFDPFFTTKKFGEGTGMGLAIVHGIVQKHAGIIRVESDSENGTAFHCYFPTISENA